MDVIGALRTFLTADTGVQAFTGVKVFGGSVPKETLAGGAGPVVLLRRVGGGTFGRVNQFGDKRVDVDCYGANEKQASDLFDAVYTALKNMGTVVVGDLLIHWAACAADGTSGHDPATEWPVCIGTFQVLVAEVPVTT